MNRLDSLDLLAQAYVKETFGGSMRLSVNAFLAAGFMINVHCIWAMLKYYCSPMATVPRPHMLCSIR